MESTKSGNTLIKAGVVIILLAILAVGVYFILRSTGVFDEQKDGYSAVFVVGATENSRTINFDDNPLLNERIDRVVNTYGYAAIVVADGMPANQTSVFDFSIHRPGKVNTILETGTIEDNLMRFRRHFSDEMQNKRSQTPEKDVLEAVSLAARMLSSRPDDEMREIVVLSTGLSTAGFLNFADDNAWLYSNAAAIIEILQKSNSLPDLDGIVVSWFQMHDVCGALQEIIPGTQRSNLEEIWRLIVTSSGGEFNIFDTHPGTGIYEGLPPVSIVEIFPEITGVRINPPQADVQKGTSHDFSALVAGFGITAQDVEWSVEGPLHPGTAIDENGRLTVATDDPRESIVIIAMSANEPNVSGKAIVNLSDEPLPPATVREILMLPEELILGTETPYNVYDINVMVLGDNNPSQAVSLELIGNNDPNTRIDSAGRIFVGSGETALGLIIKATSEIDPEIHAEMTVRVFGETPEIVEVLFVGDSAIFINKTQAREAVRGWVEFINEQNSGIYLFGCTANLGHSGSNGVALGMSRAEAVKELFVKEHNVESSKITTKGLGHNNPWNRPNGVSGTPSWNEAVASTNRRVVIMSADDDFAKKIYSETWWN